LSELAAYARTVKSKGGKPHSAPGDQAAAFDADLAASLGHHSDGGVFTETVSFVCELARKPD
jgi:hypothetical protein